MAHPVDELTMKYFLVDKIESKVYIHSDSRHCNAMPDQVRILFITTYFLFFFFLFSSIEIFALLQQLSKQEFSMMKTYLI